VTNAGTSQGDEVAQLYIRENVGSVETPERSLQGFARVHLLPGQKQTVSFHVAQHQLAVWNAEGRWVVEPGSYTAWAGGSSEAPLTTTFHWNP
jgi:beta-glucosidase